MSKSRTLTVFFQIQIITKSEKALAFGVLIGIPFIIQNWPNMWMLVCTLLLGMENNWHFRRGSDDSLWMQQCRHPTRLSSLRAWLRGERCVYLGVSLYDLCIRAAVKCPRWGREDCWWSGLVNSYLARARNTVITQCHFTRLRESCCFKGYPCRLMAKHDL